MKCTSDQSTDNQAPPAVLYYRMGDGPSLVRDVLESKGWQPYVEGSSPYWNLWWKGSRYRNSEYENCRPWQRLNHFPKTAVITRKGLYGSFLVFAHLIWAEFLSFVGFRKDTLFRLLRTMKGIHGAAYDFFPQGFSLPNEYLKFVRVYSEEDEKGLQVRDRELCPAEKFPTMWICKPADSSRGRGIFVFRNLCDLTYDCHTMSEKLKELRLLSAIVQRYIPRPWLISGYKFDMRCYVVVKSYNPLIVYLYDEGLARFATDLFADLAFRPPNILRTIPTMKSSYDTTALGNVFSHLTNTSINKLSPTLDHNKDEIGPGCRWTFRRLRAYFEDRELDFDRLWRRMQGIILLTLLPVSPEVPKTPGGCFELYGFDIIIDESMRPWLLEVNLSPALSVESDVDMVIKRFSGLDFALTRFIFPKPLIEDVVAVAGITQEHAAQAEAYAATQAVQYTKGSPSLLPGFCPPPADARIGNFRRIFPYNRVSAGWKVEKGGSGPSPQLDVLATHVRGHLREDKRESNAAFGFSTSPPLHSNTASYHFGSSPLSGEWFKTSKKRS
ncbi:tubulin-tyrosine ligase family-domain-containing protein [Blyttiomyces helicus]|uniref:Tubulin-tyrosine ligase family-domain-containing protein n=1 Tax=Blyttiomyces helicus TaxID=388810 RepID=A0A4P9WJF5_9FUNG|nr:tubulin-tyrosine ligase family-domain-containing protein [Blyttiomyces helicus]|eukprot:RKO92073.1 tubulin-tyrosine ligase family-domain-containing protein [Blyttiomyces helicus]